MIKMCLKSVAVICVVIASSNASPDLSTMVSKNMKSVGGGGSFSLSYLCNDYNSTYEFYNLSTSLNFYYESFFRNRWSIEFSPAAQFVQYTGEYTSLGIFGTGRISYYFNEHNILPYVKAGTSVGYSNYNSRYSFVWIPSAMIGIRKEITNQLYFDLGLALPTFWGFSSNQSSSEFGFTDISTPVSFGIRYYY